MAEIATSNKESRVFEADVSRLLHMMVHSVYSEKDVFLRELISNAADACEKLRYEAIASPILLGDDAKLRITITLVSEASQIVVEDNGIGMNRDEIIEALGTIARSGTKDFIDRLQASQTGDGAKLIGQFGVGFYSAFMVADRVDVASRRAGDEFGVFWSSDGKGSYSVSNVNLEDAPTRGTRVTLHLKDDSRDYAQKVRIEELVKAQSGHVPVPISVIVKPGDVGEEISDGAALWTKAKGNVSSEEYTDFYRSVAGQFDEPALTVHFHAEGRYEYTALAFIPKKQPFDLFDPDRKGRIKLYVKRVFITDEAEILPRYLRFVRGIVDSADLPLNVSREMIQESSILGAIRKGLTGRVLADLEKLSASEPETYLKIWETFGGVIKEGLYEDFERRDTLLSLARFRSTVSGDGWRTLKDYVAALKENQTAIYYLAGDDLVRLADSPHLEGFRARGIEVLFLPDPVDSFWVTSALGFDGKPFKSVTQGTADLASISLVDVRENVDTAISADVASFIAFAKEVLGDAVLDIRASDRLTESAVCLVATDLGPDRRLAKILAGAGRGTSALKPILEINPNHPLIAAVASVDEQAQELREDAAHLLLDEARILDGEAPADPKRFSVRLARIMRKAFAA